MKNCVGAKNERCLFLMGTTTSITVRSLEKIVQRAPAVGAKMWYLLPAVLPQSVNTAVLNLLMAKNQVIRPLGATRCTDACQTKQRRRAPGSVWLCKMFPQSAERCGNAAQKNIRNFHFFGKESPSTGPSPSALDRLLKF